MKKVVTPILLFIIYTLLVNSCPLITSMDKKIIMFIQILLKDAPINIALWSDRTLYTIMIVVPIIIASTIFIIKKVYWKVPFLAFLPLITFLVNKIVKSLVHRPRPEIELQQLIHPSSFSFVSSHSLVTFCLWAFLIYLVNKYFKNIILKVAFTMIGVLWILFVGFSRVWLGVHYPTDIIGAYFLGGLLVYIFIQCYENINNRLKKNEESSCSF